MFLVLGIGVGILEHLPSDEISGLFLKGSSSLLSAAFLVGFGTSISLILAAGGITDTIIHGLSQALSLAPRWSQGACMYLANMLVNVFITSGTAQSSVVMPIFILVADHLEMTRQTAVLAIISGTVFPNISSSHLQHSDGDPGRGENFVWAVGEVYGKNVSDLGRSLLHSRHRRPSDPAGAVLTRIVVDAISFQCYTKKNSSLPRHMKIEIWGIA